MVGEDCRMGAVFPSGNAISDVCLLCFGQIQEKIASGEWKFFSRRDDFGG